MQNWRRIQKENFTSLNLLADFLELNEENRQQLDFSPKFILNLPKRLASKMQKNTLADPLFRQFVPTLNEKVKTLHFFEDPVGDKAAKCSGKLLQKYEGRALLLPTSACAMHCRYCFRQNFPYSHEKGCDDEILLLKQDPSITEAILSGGDPLSLSNEALEKLLTSLCFVKRIRFHSRFAVGIPERVDEGFIELLKKYDFQYWFIVHINHPKELDEDVLAALKKLQKIGIPVLNQAVLLKGVNDSEAVLEDLFRLLADNGIFAYYLHQLDKVQGSAHFEVKEERGLELIKHLEKKLPGYAVPKYVREIAGEPSKTAIF